VIASTQPTLLPGLTLFRRGKVRDTYLLGDDLLMVASDRISAFDVILPTPIPGKGRILTQLSRFWFGRTEQIVPNHLITATVDDFPPVLADLHDELAGRSMLVRRGERIDIECVVRGYLAGSAWREYLASGTVAGVALPAGLPQSQKFPQPIFTPAMKNDDGHDENISIETLRSMVGTDLASRLESISQALYAFASNHTAQRGIILADTKFEFGWIDGELHLIDEILTPDSSRFWDATGYEPGQDQPSFDKQYVRDWLMSTGWDKEPPAPDLPSEVVAGTLARYQEAFDRLAGEAK
jgi:phosphoribosylaminoimidazole-succinocarboxamide synthase